MLLTGLQVHQSVETKHQVLILQSDPPFELPVAEGPVEMQIAVQVIVQGKFWHPGTNRCSKAAPFQSAAGYLRLQLHRSEHRRIAQQPSQVEGTCDDPAAEGFIGTKYCRQPEITEAAFKLRCRPKSVQHTMKGELQAEIIRKKESFGQPGTCQHRDILPARAEP